jgi:hypothetical protein
MEYTDLIYENYNTFLKDHTNDLSSPQGAMEMLTSQGMFDAYVTALTDKIPAESKSVIEAVCRREREVLLEESINVGPQSSAIGYAVTYFPILTDIYSDPVISRIATVYPTDKPIMTIPRSYINGSVKELDGSITSYRMPRNTNMVRGAQAALIIAASPSNVFDLVPVQYPGSAVTADNAKINNRFFFINNIKANDGTVDINVPVTVRPDARGQISRQFKFPGVTGADAGVIITGSMIGNIDYDTGLIQFGVTFSGGTLDYASAAPELTANTIFSATRGDTGRVKVEVKMEGYDVNIDVRDDFEISLFTEKMQDYRAIYDIDLVRTLSQAIKSQILLNKDQDLSLFLQAYEAEMAENGTAANVDLTQFTTAAATPEFTPANILDVFKGVVPMISAVSRKIRTNFRADPQYLLAGEKTAAIMESMQEFVSRFPVADVGESGYASGTGIDFRKQTVLSTPALPEDKIYVVYKSPSDDLSRTAIVDLIYKPLYVIEEVTNSEKRTFVRTRSALEFTAIESMGVINIQNWENYVDIDPTPTP